MGGEGLQILRFSQDEIYVLYVLLEILKEERYYNEHTKEVFDKVEQAYQSEKRIQQSLEDKCKNESNTYVYCTNCQHFRLCNEGIPYCMYENICDINNCEDSRPLWNRPMYRKRVV